MLNKKKEELEDENLFDFARENIKMMKNPATVDTLEAFIKVIGNDILIFPSNGSENDFFIVENIDAGSLKGILYKKNKSGIYECEKEVKIDNDGNALDNLNDYYNNYCYDYKLVHSFKKNGITFYSRDPVRNAFAIRSNNNEHILRFFHNNVAQIEENINDTGGGIYRIEGKDKTNEYNDNYKKIYCYNMNAYNDIFKQNIHKTYDGKKINIEYNGLNKKEFEKVIFSKLDKGSQKKIILKEFNIDINTPLKIGNIEFDPNYINDYYGQHRNKILILYNNNNNIIKKYLYECVKNLREYLLSNDINSNNYEPILYAKIIKIFVNCFDYYNNNPNSIDKISIMLGISEENTIKLFNSIKKMNDKLKLVTMLSDIITDYQRKYIYKRTLSNSCNRINPQLYIDPQTLKKFNNLSFDSKKNITYMWNDENPHYKLSFEQKNNYIKIRQGFFINNDFIQGEEKIVDNNIYKREYKYVNKDSQECFKYDQLLSFTIENIKNEYLEYKNAINKQSNMNYINEKSSRDKQTKYEYENKKKELLKKKFNEILKKYKDLDIKSALIEWRNKEEKKLKENDNNDKTNYKNIKSKYKLVLPKVNNNKIITKPNKTKTFSKIEDKIKLYKQKQIKIEKEKKKIEKKENKGYILGSPNKNIYSYRYNGKLLYGYTHLQKIKRKKQIKTDLTHF